MAKKKLTPVRMAQLNRSRGNRRIAALLLKLRPVPKKR